MVTGTARRTGFCYSADDVDYHEATDTDTTGTACGPVATTAAASAARPQGETGGTLRSRCLSAGPGPAS